MRIAFVSAGAAGMYCGSCLQDNTLASALQRMGHDVALIPTYTPMRTDETDVSIGRVFYGAISIYLQQKASLFRHIPGPVDRLLNHPWLLNLATRLGTSNDPADLGALTLSVLQGEHGRQARELRILVDWMAEHFHPDVVHLTNSLFLGLVAPIKKRLGVPVVCSVQGEDLFLEGLKPPYRSEVRSALRARAQEVDGFIATCDSYARDMSGYLGVPEDRMHVVPLGLNLEGHGSTERTPNDDRFVIGYLARLCPEKGLHLLAEGFQLLAAEAGPDRVRLRVAGYLGPRDRAYAETVRKRIRSWGLEGATEFLGEVDRPAKLRFLSSLDVLSVPTVYPDPKGRFILESLANGVPVVQPRHGAFPEMIERTRGGVLVEPGSPAALAAAFRDLMSDPERRRAMGRRGREAVRDAYNDRTMAEGTLRAYAAAGGAAHAE